MIGKLLTVSELAQASGRSVGWIYRRIYLRQIPFVQLNARGGYYFREDEITAWLERQTVRPETPPRTTRSREEECERLGIPTEHAFS